ncbi:hypothetical protein GWK47_007209 [Chionoecetes opilio]|uniref:Uncharacterized protein n=1 Tax=Chionoecetes opilio TaxID=41210 RepID=A0A8J4Y9B7_CHIOP|nr:hypothetical protein GWK47_007209 [Chionoecetes opilio]
MSSSCVPPKNCVVHDPDPSGHDDHSDTSSECGSLCTCTSGSLASIATIGNNNNRVPDRLGQDGESAALVPSSTGTQVVPQAAVEDEDHSYFAVRVPHRVVCCRKLKTPAVATSLKRLLLTTIEFFPVLAGFMIIYYSYYWWGMASGFSAFFFMVGAHAVLRLIRTRGVLSCIPYSSQTQAESDPSEGEDEEEADLQQVSQQGVIDRSAEKPPSYDAAVVKPPPYDLQLHLTPKELQSGPADKARRPTVPATVLMDRWTQASNIDDSENDTLPSYQDAVKLSHRDGRDPRDGEHS